MDECEFGVRNYDKRLRIKNAIVVKFAHMYVPVHYVDTIFKYWDVKSHVSGNVIAAPDRRFLDAIPTYQTQCVNNIKPYTNKEGKTDVKELLAISKKNAEKTPYAGGMGLCD